MANHDPNENQNQQAQQNGNDKPKGKAILDYSLLPLGDNVVFTVHSMSSEASEYLRQKGVFTASNGIRVAGGFGFPEWKESLNLVYLTTRQADRPDITRMAPGAATRNSGMILKNKVNMLKAALEQFCDEVKSTMKISVASSKPENGGRVVLR